MAYREIWDLNDELQYILEGINQEHNFENIDDFNDYIFENQVILEYEIDIATCFDLARLLMFEGYDIIEYAHEYDFENCDNLTYLLDVMIQNYFLEHCHLDSKTKKVVWNSH